jgi:carboxyl-terminal processing protease
VLSLAGRPDNNNNDNDSKERRQFMLDPVTQTFDHVTKSVQESVENARTRLEQLLRFLPAPLRNFYRAFFEKLHAWKGFLVSFTAGAFLATAAIIYPIYASVESLSQPVTLFETILGDLEQAYVEEVDTNKLFETGIAAMLRSLDPYTEFEAAQEAVALTESIEGRYGGVGLVIAGTPRAAAEPKSNANQLLPAAAQSDTASQEDTERNRNTMSNVMTEEEEDEYMDRKEQRKALEKARKQGIRVVTAFEGYAFDYGLRVGDKLLAIDDKPLTADTTVEDVRNMLRGQPGTLVSIEFNRDGVDDVQTVTMPRAVVRLRDVKLATLVGSPRDGIGYIQLSGFTSNAGAEMRQAITYLQQRTLDATNGDKSLQGLVLDLRGNPGGLLTSAVDVASLLVPNGSDIVSARGRGFPGMLYRSRVDPILNPNTKLAVLVNGQTASAAEIVAGAVQDLDVGVIVGADRSFGKGLVQNVEELPFNTALKFTVAKYYTPSGRCIQGVNYKGGGGLKEENGGYIASKVADADRKVYYTKAGRMVRDGGGVEADYKIEAPKASALEVTLLRSGMFNEYAAEWSKTHMLTNNFAVDEDTYRNFIAFVDQKQKTGDIELDALYSRPLSDLKKALKRSGYKGAEKEVEVLQANIVREVQKDFDKYRKDIKEDISQGILARYLPESMLIERGMKNDAQVEAAIKLVANKNTFDKILAQGNTAERMGGANSLNMASGASAQSTSGVRATIQW